MHSQDTRLPVRCAYDPQTDTIRPVGSDGLAPGEQAFTLEQVTCHLEARVENLARATDGTGPVGPIGQTVRSHDHRYRAGGGIAATCR